MKDDGGRIVHNELAKALMAEFARESILHQLVRDNDTWEKRLQREVWRRSLRGRWWFFKDALRVRTEGIRRRIARRIYYFLDD